MIKAYMTVLAAVGVVLGTMAIVQAWGQNRVPRSATTPLGGAMVVETMPTDAAGMNPLYRAWQGQAGKTVMFTRTEQISGGAPMPAGAPRAATSSTVQFALAEITADRALVKVVTPDNAAGDTLTIPAKMAADDPALPKAAGVEKLTIGHMMYACTKYTYTTNAKAEMGQDGQGLRGSVTAWLADGVPGGVVQRQISLTIRATYDLTDILAAVGTTPATTRVGGAGTGAAEFPKGTPE